MMTVTFIIGDIAMDDGYSTTEFITDEHGLTMLQSVIDELVHSQNEFIVLIDGVPYRWDFWYGV